VTKNPEFGLNVEETAKSMIATLRRNVAEDKAKAEKRRPREEAPIDKAERQRSGSIGFPARSAIQFGKWSREK
jgi:hypothetical protein